jgi:transposase-like protein
MTKQRKQRKTYTVDAKLKIIKEILKAPSQASVAKKYDISTSTLNDWCKNREKFLEMASRGENLEAKRIDNNEFSKELNKRVFTWFLYMRERNSPVEGPMLQEKARLVAQHINPAISFSGSQGWLTNFCKKYQLVSNALSGESRSVPMQLVHDWIDNLNETTQGYTPDCIYNCDETGIFFRSLPDRSYVSPGDDRKNSKVLKERFTALCTVSATGEKLPLLIIGRSKKPREFTLNIRNGIHYYYNKKAWMTIEIFNDYLENLNNLMRIRGKKILLVMDNAPVHASNEYSHIKIVKLPPNTTSKTQPLDAGIIKNLKYHYRKHFLRFLVNNVDDDVTADGAAKTINFSLGVTWLKFAWECVTTETIIACWKKVGFMADQEIEILGEVPLIDEEFREYASLLQIDNPEEIIEDFPEVYDQGNQDWENEILFPAPVAEQTPEEIIEIEGEPEERITNRQILSAWKVVRNGLLQRGDQEILNLTNDLTRHLARISFEGKKKQVTLDDFFTSNNNHE